MLWVKLALVAFTAIGTVGMAISTYYLIRQNKRHYQDESRPVCMLVIWGSTDRFAREGFLRIQAAQSHPTKRIQLLGQIINIGTGPALHVYLHIRLPSKNCTLISCELPPLGAKSAWGDDMGSIFIPVEFPPGFTDGDFAGVPGESWELYLTYVDVFGNKFYAKHAKDSQQPWVVLGKGNVPGKEA